MTVTKQYLEETKEIVTALQDMADEITRLKEKVVATPAQLFQMFVCRLQRKRMQWLKGLSNMLIWKNCIHKRMIGMLTEAA